MRWLLLIAFFLVSIGGSVGCGDKDHGKFKDKDRPRATDKAGKPG